MDVKVDIVVFLRVFTDEVYNLVAETVVALAKLVVDVTSLKPFEENHDSVLGQAKVTTRHVSQETFERTLPWS